MVNQLKIITMTRLALYDKHEGVNDRIVNAFFRHDHIYRNNLGTRFAVGLGSIIILVIYWLQAILLNERDLFELDFRQYGIDSLMFIIAVLAVYSLIGTIQGTRQYYLVQKRLAQYQALVRQLERLEERATRVYDDEETEASPAKRRRTPPPVEKTKESEPPKRTKPVAAPGAGYTAPLVRTGGALPTPVQDGTERPVPTGYTRPPSMASADATGTRPPRPMPADATMVPRPMPPDATRAPRSMSPDAPPPRPRPADTTAPPRPIPPDATKPPRPRPLDTTNPPPRPAPPAGYARPHPSMATAESRPPRPYPAPSPIEDVRSPEDTPSIEHTRVPRLPERHVDS